MKLLEVVDEFSNQEITLDHLRRVRKARCHQYVIYFNLIKDKYPDWPALKINLHGTIQGKSSSGTTVGQFRRNITQPGNLPPDVVDKLVKMYVRVKEAKIAYEKAGGQSEADE